MGWESSDVVRFDLGPLLQGQTRIPKLKVLITHLLVVLEVCNVKPKCRKSWTGILLMCSYLSFGPLLQGQTRIAKLKNAYNLLIIGPRGLGCETNLEDIMGWESSDVV